MKCFCLSTFLCILEQNFGEEEVTDEMFDSLFEKYGKVVFQSNDKKSRSDEIDDDSESLSCKSFF